MLSRFASAVSVASPVAALATVNALLVLELRPEVLSHLTSLWCVLPAVWGVWAMLAPRAWVPQRLPLWGAFLGFLVGTLVVFALDWPAQLFGLSPPASVRGLLVLVLIILYYLLWMVVRVVSRALAGDDQAGA